MSDRAELVWWASLFGMLCGAFFSVLIWSASLNDHAAAHKAQIQEAIADGAAMRVVDQTAGDVTIKFGCPCQEESK